MRLQAWQDVLFLFDPAQVSPSISPWAITQSVAIGLGLV
jgi:hypothetical protein